MSDDSDFYDIESSDDDCPIESSISSNDFYEKMQKNSKMISEIFDIHEDIAFICLESCRWNYQKVLDELNNSGVRAEIDTRAEKIGYKIREAQMKKIPYMLVVGAKEEEDGLVSVRSRFEGDEGQKSLTDFLAAIKMEIQAKTAREVKKEDDK